MSDEKTIMDESIDAVKDVQDKVNEVAKDKDPDGMNSHETILFNEISEGIIKMMKDPEIANLIMSLSKTLNPQAAKTLVDLLASVFTFGTYQAIAFYDNSIKEMMEANFQIIGNSQNILAAQINALQLKVGDIEKSRIIQKAQIQVDPSSFDDSDSMADDEKG